MRQLIDFITDNISLLIFLFLLAAPLLGKLRQSLGGPVENRPPARMPSFGGDRSDQDLERKEKERKAAIRAAQRMHEEQQRNEREAEAVGEGLTLEGRAALSRPVQPPAQTARHGRTSGLPVSRPEGEAGSGEDQGLRLEEEDLARGVVWAEILGPPRAKRPYRR